MVGAHAYTQWHDGARAYPHVVDWPAWHGKKFNLAVWPLIAKSPNESPRQKFPALWYTLGSFLSFSVLDVLFL